MTTTDARGSELLVGVEYTESECAQVLDKATACFHTALQVKPRMTWIRQHCGVHIDLDFPSEPAVRAVTPCKGESYSYTVLGPNDCT